MVFRPRMLSGYGTTSSHLCERVSSITLLVIAFLFPLLARADHSLPSTQWSPSGKRIAILEGYQDGSDAKLDILTVATRQRKTVLSTKQIREIQRQADAAAGFPEGKRAMQIVWMLNEESILLTNAHWLVRLDLPTATWHVLLSSNDALSHCELAPSGTKVSFVRSHRLWLLRLADSIVVPFTKEVDSGVLQGELGSQYEQGFRLKDAYWWSPDGSRIAFLETQNVSALALTPTGAPPTLRNDAGRPACCVVKLKVASTSDQKETARLLLTTVAGDYLVRATWFPNSESLAVEKVSAKQDELTLLAIDSRSGSSHVILVERDKYWINVATPPVFLSGKTSTFVWSSERTGYRHLFLYNTAGDLLRQLTNGRWDVRDLVDVDERKQCVYFSSGKDDPSESNLYRVQLGGSEPFRITRKEGWHVTAASPGSAFFADNISNAVTPPHTELISSSGQILQALSTDPSPSNGAIRSEFVTLSAHDDVVLHGLFLKPASFDPKRHYPIIMEAGGGPGEQIVKDGWDPRVSPWNRLLVQHGFIVFAMDPRGSAGYGHPFEEPVHYWLGGQESADERDAVAYLHKLPFVDPNRIGIWGSEYGGKLAVDALIHEPDDFKAAYAQSPIVDWLTFNPIFAERYLGPARDRGEEYRQSSLLEDAERLKGALLLSTVQDEDLVPTGDVIRLRSILKQSGIPSKLQLLQGGDKALADHWEKQVLPFFESALR